MRCTGMRCAAPGCAALRRPPGCGSFRSFPFPPAPVSVPPRSPPPPPQPRPRPPFLPLRRHRETTWAPGGRQRPPPGPRRYRPDPSPSVRPSGSAEGRPRRRPPAGQRPTQPGGSGAGAAPRGAPLHPHPHGAVGPRAEPSRSRARWGAGRTFYSLNRSLGAASITEIRVIFLVVVCWLLVYFFLSPHVAARGL